MLIKNLTNKQQSFDVKELTGENKIYTIYLTPYGCTEVDRVILVNPDQYAGIFAVDGKPIVAEGVKSIAPVVKNITLEEIHPATFVEKVNKVEEVEDTPVEAPVAEDSFICDICGAEFASARGLAAHKNKTHTNE